jgi:hypothetical protein
VGGNGQIGAKGDSERDKALVENSRSKIGRGRQQMLPTLGVVIDG